MLLGAPTLDFSKRNNVYSLFLDDVDPLEGELAIIWPGREINKVLIEKKDGTGVFLGDGMSVDKFVPVVAVPDFEKRRSQDADVVLIDGVVEN